MEKFFRNLSQKRIDRKVASPWKEGRADSIHDIETFCNNARLYFYGNDQSPIALEQAGIAKANELVPFFI